MSVTTTERNAMPLELVTNWFDVIPRLADIESHAHSKVIRYRETKTKTEQQREEKREGNADPDDEEKKNPSQNS